MLSFDHISDLRKIVSLLLLFVFTSCAYYNTFYNAEESFENAKQIINLRKYTETDLPIDAKKFLDEAIVNSKIVIQKYPDSKWVEDAYYIIAVSMLLKDDFQGSKDYFSLLLNKFPSSKYQKESKLWISLCNLKLENIEEARISLSLITNSNIKLSRYENFLLYQILADLSIFDEDIKSAYENLNTSLKYSSDDKEKINIYNKLISLSEEFVRYDDLVFYLNKLYNTLEEEKDKKDIKLVEIEYNKKLNNYDYLISEIERLLSLSSFNDKRLFLTLELGKIYYEMGDFSTAKEIFHNIVSENSKKKETSEAYYLLAKINMEEEFNFDTIKELLEKSKTEKSSSKFGKLSKKTISKIEDLQDLIYEYELSVDTADSLSNLDKVPLSSDSLLFYMAESFYFDFANTDSAFFRYRELVKKFPDSDIYVPKTLYALSWLDSSSIYIGEYLEGSWLKIVESIFPNQSTEIVVTNNSISQFDPIIDLLDKGKYESAYLLLDDILADSDALKFYKGLIDEMFLFNTTEMLKNYIEYVNLVFETRKLKGSLGGMAYLQSQEDNVRAANDKLSSYYYIINEDIKYLKSKRKLSECGSKIIINSELDSIYSCFEEINDFDDYYSYDSLKVRLGHLIEGSPSAFKRRMGDFDVKYNTFKSTFKYIKDNISTDSTYSLDSIEDSLLIVINNSIFSLESSTIDEKIDKLDGYLSMYDDISLNPDIRDDKDKMKDERMDPFRELELENLDLEKMKLNLTK